MLFVRMISSLKKKKRRKETNKASPNKELNPNVSEFSMKEEPKGFLFRELPG